MSYCRGSRFFLLNLPPHQLGYEDHGESDDNADKDRFVVPIWVDLYVTVGMFRADDRETVIDGEDSHDNQGEITEARDQEIAASGGLSGVLAEAEGESDTGSGEACEEEGYGEDAERVNFSFGMLKKVGQDDAPCRSREGGDELPKGEDSLSAEVMRDGSPSVDYVSADLRPRAA